MRHGLPVLGDPRVPLGFLSLLTLRGQLGLLPLEHAMCVAELGVTLGSTAPMDQHPVQRHPALRLKMTTDLWVVTSVDGQGATVSSIVLVGQHFVRHHLVLSPARTIDLGVVMSVGHLAVIAETTQTSVLISHRDRLLPHQIHSSRETAPGVRHRATGLRPHSSARSPSSRGLCP